MTKIEPCLSTTDEVNGWGNHGLGLPGLNTYEVERADQ